MKKLLWPILAVVGVLGIIFLFRKKPAANTPFNASTNTAGSDVGTLLGTIFGGQLNLAKASAQINAPKTSGSAGSESATINAISSAVNSGIGLFRSFFNSGTAVKDVTPKVNAPAPVSSIPDNTVPVDFGGDNWWNVGSSGSDAWVTDNGF